MELVVLHYNFFYNLGWQCIETRFGLLAVPIQCTLFDLNLNCFLFIFTIYTDSLFPLAVLSIVLH